ncbi:DNA/RNA non-specific endonuclease [Idiomarina xiamenensis]|uniref:Endonuclease n=1 Tax=Idiomarina xiamenensis 10-D-4 TaxID=740709 RepID=K2KSN2_9GAMM|nr:DNA/RNA non-specific endonuclease [Idiomarina xiamenensis]EKE80610.1 endonuclease [Idiomarina xiamenensis 10-D-4]
MRLHVFIYLSLATLLGLFSVNAYADNCLHGCPTGASGQQVNRAIYSLSNNADTKFADWVAYHVTASTIDGPSRSRYWRQDPALPSSDTLAPADYQDAHATIGTDRGHQVPLASFSNTPYWSETNYLSNITPQRSELNQGAWVKLENAVRQMVREGQDVYVVTGPLYEYYFASLPSSSRSHTIPSAYYKVVMTNVDGWIEASAFIMDQSLPRNANYCQYQVSVYQVEQRASLTLMPQLPSWKEGAVKGQLGGLSQPLGC